MSRSSSDYPISPWLKNAIAQDREDIAAGREPWREDVWLEEQRLARASRRKCGAEYEGRIYSEAEKREGKM